jgi:L-fuculose-phosphate aldolase
LWLANEVETLAKQYLLARGLGMPVLLDSIEMKTIVERLEKYKNHQIEQKK